MQFFGKTKASRFGCCPDGRESALDGRFGGCENRLLDGRVCGLDKDRGSCRNFTVKWFFDMEYGGCSRFWWGGCDGNDNRFPTQDDCKAHCVDPEPASKSLFCLHPHLRVGLTYQVLEMRSCVCVCVWAQSRAICPRWWVRARATIRRGTTKPRRASACRSATAAASATTTASPATKSATPPVWRPNASVSLCSSLSLSLSLKNESE